jgi:hypothetical protein
LIGAVSEYIKRATKNIAGKAIDAIDTSSAAWRAQLFSRLLLLHPLLLPASNFVGG